MPAESTVRGWTVDDVQGFAAHYTRAREIGYEGLAEEIVEISDRPAPSLDNGATDSGDVAHRRLQVDTRKWLLSKMLPKVYGDKQQVEHSGNIGLADAIVAARKRTGG